MFTLYSLSKPFCAIGLLKLKDKKLIDIDRHPGDYLPEAKGFDEGVTIRHLLNHTSGIPDFEQNTDFRQRYNGETSERRKFALKIVCPKDGMYLPRETSNL